MHGARRGPPSPKIPSPRWIGFSYDALIGYVRNAFYFLLERLPAIDRMFMTHNVIANSFIGVVNVIYVNITDKT